MASQKEYAMMFSLNAKMNGGFNAAFSKAQSEFTRLGKEIQGLHRAQGDISSYQKQEKALEATRTKLENLMKQHGLLQKEIGETEGSTSGLERENVKLEQRIRDTQAALERQGQKLSDTGTRLEQAGVNTRDLTGESTRLAGKLKELHTEQDKVADSAAEFGEKATGAFGAVRDAIAAAGITVSVREITQAWLECMSAAGDFQEQMSGVQAISGATAQEMDLLTDKAKYMGANTKFTAKEAGQAMEYMAMAGWKAGDMLDGLGGVMDLAAASGEDLSSTSDIVTDALTAFGLKAADSGRFADILAVAASKANTNVGMMGDTFKYVAPVAGALGYAAEDTAVQIGLMANSGIKASMAGTQLRTIITRLSTDAGASSTQLGALGVLTEKLGVAFYNTDGSARELNAVVADSRAAWAGLSKEQQINYAKTIAGQEAMSGWLALMNAADTDVQALTNSVNNCSGAARRMADVRLDNLNGQLTLMDSAVDALKTTIGEQFIPEARGAAEIGTALINGLDEFAEKNPGVVKGVTLFTGVMGGAAVAITGVSAAMKVLGALNLTTMFTNPVFLAVGAAAALGSVIYGIASSADAAVPSVKELTGAARDMREAMDEAGAAHEETTGKTLATAEAAGMYIDKLEELEAAQGENARESQEYQNILALLLRTVPELSDCISETTDEYGRSTYALEGSTQALRQNTEEWKKNAEAKAYQDYINSLYDQYGEVMQEAAANSIKLTEAQMRLENAEKSHTDALDRMAELEREAAEGSGVLNQEYYALQNSLQGYLREMYSAQEEIDVLNKAIDADTEAVAAAESEIDSATAALERYTGATQDQTGADAEAAAQSQELQGAISNITAQVDELVAAYNEAYSAALESIGGQYALWDEAAQVAETSVGDINVALESQAQYWQAYNANLQSLADRTGEIEGLGAVIASFADGSADSVNAVAGMANATDDELKQMVSNWQEVQREQETTAGSLADMKTDMTALMDELGLALAEDIEGMDLSEEAKAAGRATIQGYINGAGEMLPGVRGAFEAVRAAAAGPLGMGYSSNSAYHNGQMTKMGAYASGTDSAKPGVALVGEEGPELVLFHGGEKVLNANQTAGAITNAEPVSALPAQDSGGSEYPPISLVVQVQGNASQQTVEDLRTSAQEIVNQVLDALDERAEDEKRCSMR